MTISFIVYGTARPAGSKTPFKSHTTGKIYVKDSSGKLGADWRRSVAQSAGVAMSGLPLLEGPLRMDLFFYMARPKGHYRANGHLKDSAPPFPIGKPDTTKLLRSVEDSLKGIVLRDDSQIVQQYAQKDYGSPVRVEVRVFTLNALGIIEDSKILGGDDLRKILLPLPRERP